MAHYDGLSSTAESAKFMKTVSRPELPKPNKAHTATANRVARRYGGEIQNGDGPHVVTDEMDVYIVTTATMRPILRELTPDARPAYFAVTNQEAVVDVLKVVQGTHVGVLSPKGDILLHAGAT